jgi:hypothetical protein
MLKLGARTRTHAVARALAYGEIAPGYSGIPSESNGSDSNGAVAAEESDSDASATVRPLRANG